MKYESRPPRAAYHLTQPEWAREHWQYTPSDNTPSVTVHEKDRDTFSGLYDHNGNELHTPRQPFGFVFKPKEEL